METMEVKYDALIRVNWGIKVRLTKKNFKPQVRATSRKTTKDRQQNPQHEYIVLDFDLDVGM